MVGPHLLRTIPQGGTNVSQEAIQKPGKHDVWQIELKFICHKVYKPTICMHIQYNIIYIYISLLLLWLLLLLSFLLLLYTINIYQLNMPSLLVESAGTNTPRCCEAPEGREHCNGHLSLSHCWGVSFGNVVIFHGMFNDFHRNSLNFIGV